MIELQGRRIYKGKAEGEALVTGVDLSFYGGVDPETGEVVEKDHPLEGLSVASKILVMQREGLHGWIICSLCSQKG